jgi:hypothetical protein
MHTILTMGFLGFPIALPAYKLQRDGATLSFVDSPRGRKRRTMKASDCIVAEGDNRAVIDAAVWETRPDGSKTTRHHSFAAEWSRVMADLTVRLGASATAAMLVGAA